MEPTLTQTQETSVCQPISNSDFTPHPTLLNLMDKYHLNGADYSDRNIVMSFLKRARSTQNVMHIIDATILFQILADHSKQSGDMIALNTEGAMAIFEFIQDQRNRASKNGYDTVGALIGTKRWLERTNGDGKFMMLEGHIQSALELLGNSVN